MATPDTIPVRIQKTHAEDAKQIGRTLGFKRSLVIETALSHGLPIARQKLAATKKP